MLPHDGAEGAQLFNGRGGIAKDLDAQGAAGAGVGQVLVDEESVPRRKRAECSECRAFLLQPMFLGKDVVHLVKVALVHKVEHGILIAQPPSSSTSAVSFNVNP